MCEKPSVPIRSVLTVAPRRRANETGPLAAYWQEAGENSASCAVRFENLTVEATGVGPEKAVLIEDLHVRFDHLPVSDEGMSPTGHLAQFCALFSLGGRQGVPSLGLFDRLTDGQDDWSVPVDLTGAIEVRVRDLHWQVCRGDRTILRVECDQARFPQGTRDCVLDGATVSTKGAALKSERIALDLANKRFVARRAFVLAGPDRVQVGLRGAFARDLRLIEHEAQQRQFSERLNGLMTVLLWFSLDPFDAATACLHRHQSAMTERFCSRFICTDPCGQFARLVDRDWAPLLGLSGRLLAFVLGTGPEPTARLHERPIKSAQAKAM